MGQLARAIVVRTAADADVAELAAAPAVPVMEVLTGRAPSGNDRLGLASDR